MASETDEDLSAAELLIITEIGSLRAYLNEVAQAVALSAILREANRLGLGEEQRRRYAERLRAIADRDVESPT